MAAPAGQTGRRARIGPAGRRGRPDRQLRPARRHARRHREAAGQAARRTRPAFLRGVRGRRDRHGARLRGGHSPKSHIPRSRGPPGVRAPATGGTAVIEEEIRAAMAKQADRAPHPGPVIHALQQRTRRRRRLWPLVVAVIGTAAVAAAIAVPLALRGDNTTAPLGPQGPFVMEYTVGNLPGGYVEGSRSADVTGLHQSRIWADSRASAMILFSVDHRGSDHFDDSVANLAKDGQPVDVNGVTGYLTSDTRSKPGEEAVLGIAWQPDPDTVLSVTMVRVSGQRDTIRDVARSVRRDGHATLTEVAAFGQLPRGFQYVEAVINGGSPTAST